MSLPTAKKDNVRVAVRCRPFNQREKKLKCKYVVDVDSDNNQMALKKPSTAKASKSFRFDYVYGEHSTQKEVYEDTAYPLVESVLEGYNGTIFAYGQTGCGKTWTMEGPNNGDPELDGIIPSSFQHIFDKVNSESDPNTKFLIRAGYIEIYNEEIRDLLGNDSMKKMNLRENPDKGVYVQDLTMVTVKNVNDTQSLMNKGRSSRVVGRTNMNAVSSRSHALFVLNVETSSTVQLQSAKGGKPTEETKIKAGKLNLVDLAGSERQSKTGAQGVRFKEATKINLSLSALGNVISALVEGKGKHIPYRDSKLTRLLQDSLGGNTKTVMIACVSPAEDNYDETLSTLRYANRAKNIKNKPKINEDPKDALLKQYQDEIKKLKEMLKTNHANGGIPMNPKEKVVTREVVVKKQVSENHRELSKKYEKLKKEYEQSMKENEERQTIAKTEENEDRYHDMMENIYLLESQLLDGGHSSNNAKQRLDAMKSKRNKRRQQKQKRSSSMDSNSKWKMKYKDAQNEIEDLMSEFEKQRSDLLDEIRMTYREMCLYRDIVHKVMPPNIIDQVIYESTWDAHKESWSLPSFMDNYNQSTSVQTMAVSKQNIARKQLQPTRWNQDEFDAMEMDMIDTKNRGEINTDEQFMEQISKINQEDVFDVNAHVENKRDFIPNKDIDVEDDFIQQLSTINNIQTFKADTFSPTKQENKQHDTNLMDIANLMMEDKASFVSPAKSNLSECDDGFTEMLQTNRAKQNLFEQYKRNSLQEKQNIELDDFFQDTNDDEYSVDITELHQHLTPSM